MFRRIHFIAIAFLAVGGIIGWLTATGKLVTVLAQVNNAAV